jgi:hypothetical protein
VPETFRYPFGKPGEERFSVTSRRRRSPKRFDAVAIPMMGEVWHGGDWNQRQSVLTYLVMVQPVKGIDLAWEALTCDDEMLRSTAAIAAWTYIRLGFVPSAQLIDVLVAAVRAPNQPTTKTYLLWALEQAGYDAYESLLEDLRSDPSAEVRFDANYYLLEQGRDTKADLFADLDKLGWKVDFGVERLWWAKERLDLTPDEETFMRGRLQARVEEYRDYCRGETPENSALILFDWLKKGFPKEPEDVDYMGQAVSHGRSNDERLDAVRAVAWFDNEKARDWLRRLSEEPYQPSVRREAQRQLRELTAH